MSADDSQKVIDDAFKLTLGDGLLLKSFNHHPADTMSVTYGTPGKGAYHIACHLGVFKPGDPGPLGLGVDERLNALGWVFDPKRAERAYQKALAEKVIKS